MKKTRFAILVAGMHRSGTSATAGALQHLGIALGDRLMAGGDDNPKGYFEHEAVVQAHDTLLLELGSWWSDPRPLPSGWLETPAARRAEQTLIGIIRRDFAGASVWAVKDPRACRLLPLWLRCLDRLGITAGVLHAVRAPAEVAASLRARNGFSTAFGELLWLRHVTTALRDSRDVARAVVTYDSLLADPRAAMQRALAGFELPARPDAASTPAALDGFVDAGFRHHEAASAASDTRVGALAGKLFRAFVALEAGRGDWKPFDALCNRFDAAWTEMEPWVGAMAESVFPILDSRADAEAELRDVQSRLNAQVAWSEQAVVEHRAVVEQRDALAAQVKDAALARQAAEAEQARLASDLAAQVRWAEQAVAEHRQVAEQRDALRVEAREAGLAKQAAEAEAARLASDLAAQVRWAEQAVVEHRQVVEQRDALQVEAREAGLAKQAAEAETARLASDLAAQVRWAEQAVVEHRQAVEQRDALLAEAREAGLAKQAAEAETARLASDLAGQIRWAEQAVAEHRQVVERRDALAAQLQVTREKELRLEAELAREQAEHARVQDLLATAQRESENAAREWREAADARDELKLQAAEVAAARDTLRAESVALRGELAARCEAAGRIDAELVRVREELGHRGEELTRLREVLGQRDEQLTRLRQELGQRDEELTRLRQELGLRSEEIARSLREVATEREAAQRVETERAQLQGEAERLSLELAAMRNSRSWRWTAPLRRRGETSN